MSMEISVWSRGDVALPVTLPQADSWKQYGEEWAYEGDGWQVVVSLGEGDDPDEAVLEALPEAKTVVYVSLEPIGAAPAGYQWLEEVFRALARQSSGVWVDPNGVPHGADDAGF